MHACTQHCQQFVDRSSASVRLCDSFVNLDSCNEDGFFLFFGIWIRRTGPIFSLPHLAIDLTSTPTMLDSSRHRSSISLTTAPGIISSILFGKHVSFEHSVSSPRPVITSRREEKNSKAKVFQHPIDSHSQSASSCLISPHFAAGAVGVSRGAPSFLATCTESTVTVLIPRLMTRIVGHDMPSMADSCLHDGVCMATSRHKQPESVMAYNRHSERQCKNTAPFLDGDDLENPDMAPEIAAMEMLTPLEKPASRLVFSLELYSCGNFVQLCYDKRFYFSEPFFLLFL